MKQQNYTTNKASLQPVKKTLCDQNTVGSNGTNENKQKKSKFINLSKYSGPLQVKDFNVCQYYYYSSTDNTNNNNNK